MQVVPSAYGHSLNMVGTGMLAPARGKTGYSGPQKAGLAPPRPVKLTKPTGRSGAKLTADSIDGPFSLRLQIMH